MRMPHVTVIKMTVLRERHSLLVHISDSKLWYPSLINKACAALYFSERIPAVLSSQSPANAWELFYRTHPYLVEPVRKDLEVQGET